MLIIYHEVVINASQRLVATKDRKHSLPNTGVDFLTVTALTYGLVLIKRILDVDELGVWNIFDVDPLDVYRSGPFALLLPELIMSDIMSYSVNHLGYTAEML